jgi:hypothetical protein
MFGIFIYLYYKACLKMSREDWALEILMGNLDPKIYCKHYFTKSTMDIEKSNS